MKPSNLVKERGYVVSYVDAILARKVYLGLRVEGEVTQIASGFAVPLKVLSSRSCGCACM